MADKSQSLSLVSEYLTVRGSPAKIKDYLGGGTDGDVWSTTRNSAIKTYHFERGYINERDCYQRLADWGVTQQLDGFWLPMMQGFDDELMVVEMDLMQTPPYIIYFAKVRFDRPPDFSPDVILQLQIDGREWFGPNWPAVCSLSAALESYQIYYLDPKPHNIVFPAERQQP